MSYDAIAEEGKYLAQLISDELIGWTIIKPVKNPDGFVGFLVEKDQAQKVVWISADAEWNESGFLSVEKI